MYKLAIENEYGDKLELTNNPDYDVVKVDGLNPAPGEINSIAIAGFDGAIFNSSRIQSRNIVIYLNIHFPIEENRIALYKYIQVKRYIKVYYENEHRKVYCEGYVETFENDLFCMTQQPQISIICPDPFWKAEEEFNINFSDIVSLFEFPFAIPSGGIPFSQIRRLTTEYVNIGEVTSGAIIKFRATADGITDPTFYNFTTNKYIGVNFTMQAGDVITINTQQGHKGIKLLRGGVKTNILADRKAGSSWVDFKPGENEISYDASSGQSYLVTSVVAVRRFEGV